jgi:uncharacterized protein (TIGR02246 family)
MLIAAAGVLLMAMPVAAQQTQTTEARFVPFRPLTTDFEVILGDPDVSGQPFVMRIRELPGTIIPPHSHPVDEHITVLQGTFFFAVADKFDLSLMKELKAGGYAFAPKGSTMFGASPDGAVVQVHGVGPFHIHWRDATKSLDDAEAHEVFRFRKGDTIVGARGAGRIRQGYASGSHIQYEVELTNGSLVMETESALRKAETAPLVSASAPDDRDDASLRAIVAAQAAAWNAGDGNAYAKDVAQDVSFTNLFGMVMYGAEAFAERHRQILATFYKGTTKRHTIRRIRFVTRDVAIVDIDNELRGIKAMPAGIVVPADGVLKTQLMEVFVRRGDRWWVEAYHNVETKPQN